MTPSTDAERREPSDRTTVARTVLFGAGGFVSTIATILVVAGTWQIDISVIRLALIAVCIISGLALFVTAFIIRR